MYLKADRRKSEPEVLGLATLVELRDLDQRGPASIIDGQFNRDVCKFETRFANFYHAFSQHLSPYQILVKRHVLVISKLGNLLGRGGEDDDVHHSGPGSGASAVQRAAQPLYRSSRTLSRHSVGGQRAAQLAELLASCAAGPGIPSRKPRIFEAH